MNLEDVGMTSWFMQSCRVTNKCRAAGLAGRVLMSAHSPPLQRGHGSRSLAV